MRRLLPLLALGVACQEPFDVQRKDLGPFRIAAVGVRDGVAQAAIWSGEGAFHLQAPVLEWSLDGQPIGTGWQVEVPGTGALALEVTAPDGQVHHATVSASEPPPPFLVARAAVDLGQDLSLEARRAAAEVPVDATAPEGQAMRLTLSFPQDSDSGDSGSGDSGSGDATSEALTLRWMSAGGQGTLLEVQTLAADLLAEEVVFDDGEVASRTDSGPGIYTQLALVLDGQGGNRWSWVDAAVGVEGALLHHEDRLLALDADPSTGLLAVTLQATDDLWGLAPTDPVAVSDLAEQQALSCAPADQPFRLAWVVEGRCTRDELQDARVVLEVR